MGVTETLRKLLTIFLSTACIQNVRLFGVYDVRWPFLAEIHTAPLRRFVPSSVLQAVRALRNAPAALAVFLAGVAPVFGILENYHCCRFHGSGVIAALQIIDLIFFCTGMHHEYFFDVINVLSCSPFIFENTENIQLIDG